MANTSLTYVKKITTSLGWLRRLDAVNPETERMDRIDPQPVMRIKALIIEGWEETSDLGNYIRWIGKIGCEAYNRDGTVTEYVSRNMIMPPVVSDFLSNIFKQVLKETTIKGRTGQYFSLPDDFAEVPFVGDIYIKQPSGGKKSTTGYEFDFRVIRSPEMENPVARLDEGAPPFRHKALTLQQSMLSDGSSPLLPEPASPAPESAEEHKGKAKHKGGGIAGSG